MMRKITFTLITCCLILASGYSQTTVSTITEGNPDDAIAIDSNGNIYASNFVGGIIYKITPGGVVTEFVSFPGSNPNGLAVDSNDHLWACDFGGNAIVHIDPNGNILQTFGISGNPSGMIKAFDNDDMIYTRYNGQTINRITPAGVISEISSDALLNGPVGLAYDEFGGLYVGNYNNRKIYQVQSNGDLGEVATVGDGGNLGFIAYGQGLLWGTVLQDHKIYAIDLENNNAVIRFAGSVAGNMDGPIAQATFNRPNGIAFDSTEENMYITDFGTKNLRIISDVVLETNELQIKSAALKLYPNPAKDYINIQANLPDGGEFTISIYDLLGKIVFTSSDISEGFMVDQTIKINDLASGTYFVELRTKNFSETQQIIK